MNNVNNLYSTRVADVVYLIEHGIIIRTQVIRVTPHQIVVENGDKFWKSDGGRVGDSSKSKAVVYHASSLEVQSAYSQNKDHYQLYEWLNELQISASYKKIDLEELKSLIDMIYKKVESYPTSLD